MRICILTSSYIDSEAPYKDFDAPLFILPYLEGHDCEIHEIKKAKAIKQVRQLVDKGFDVFINLCDGAWEEDCPGIEVVQALERLNVPFTGADSRFYEPTRETMKLVCHSYGVKTPAWAYAKSPQEAEMAAKDLRFPLIVKHPNGFSSAGITRDSKVETVEELCTQVSRIVETYGEALIEEFIDGREFTVLVVENPDDSGHPFIYEPMEFFFPKGESFKHFDMKWITYQGMTCSSCSDPILAHRLKNVSGRMFMGLNGAGYGRCDIRMNAAGEIFMLEINPNCGVFYLPSDPGSADYILMNDPQGHRGFLDKIIRAAIKRHQRRQKKWKVRFDGETDYGIYATVDIEAEDVVVPYEGHVHYLVSKSHVDKTWDDHHRKWFARYAYPFTDEIWGMWSDEPEKWMPINHSCDPNAWLEGLDLVARRRIRKGEQITMDYATFCNESMEEFRCTCGSRNCRGVILGTDYLQPFVQSYGEHISDYVKNKRHSLQLSSIPKFL
jgi:D-alanine-D-alanine ligase-like ATP-grasp enzyme